MTVAFVHAYLNVHINCCIMWTHMGMVWIKIAVYYPRLHACAIQLHLCFGGCGLHVASWHSGHCLPLPAMKCWYAIHFSSWSFTLTALDCSLIS